MKFFIVLLAVVAAASAGLIVGHGGGGYGGGYGGGHAETYHIRNPGPDSSGTPAIHEPHPAPISYKGNEHTTRIHYNGPNAGHPHLVGVESYHAAAEPAIGVVKVGHGHGW